MIIKHLIRRLFNFTARYHSQELSNRVMFFTEHFLFSLWGYYCICYIPERDEKDSSWLFNTPLLWVGAESPSPSLVTFYAGKVATHLEDLLVIFCSLLFPGNDQHNDIKMIVHHVATALLCISSWFAGYLRIGSSIMLLHDVSDIPLDLVRVAGVVNRKMLQIFAMVMTLVAWGYWRLFFLPFKILRSVLLESSYSPIDAAADPTGELFNLKLRFYVILIGTLSVLHYLWFWMMLQKSYREVFGGSVSTHHKKA